jgi:hypothetical protein
MAASPTGTLIQNTHRHPAVPTTSPPTVGPRARPSAWAAACTPSATRIRSLGTLVTTSAMLLACSIAAPAACAVRQASSAASDGANPQAAEAAVNRVNP